MRQRDQLQPEVPRLRLELQRGLRLLARLVSRVAALAAAVSCVMSALVTRYYLNDLTYRTDPPKTTTESYNVRRRKSKWSEKEPRRTEAEAELSLAHLGY